jgi:hypothetical protein
VPLINTYEALLLLKPHDAQKCPYQETSGCQGSLYIPPGSIECPGCKQPIFSTDALRIHERFNDLGTNGEAFVMLESMGKDFTCTPIAMLRETQLAKKGR